MNTLLDFVKKAELNSASAYSVFKAACQDVSAKTGSNRVSIWNMDEKESFIKCACYFNADDETYTNGQILYAIDHPNYFKTIVEDNVIIAPDASAHPATAELTDPYFRENDIYSLLDFILHKDFRPIGVICCENAGTRREWTNDDVNYLRTVSTLISFYFFAN